MQYSFAARGSHSCRVVRVRSTWEQLGAPAGTRRFAVAGLRAKHGFDFQRTWMKREYPFKVLQRQGIHLLAMFFQHTQSPAVLLEPVHPSWPGHAL